eukprot:g4409.t1
MDPVESTKRLEMHVKRVSSIRVTEEPTPDGARASMASPDVQYVGSMVGEEDGFPTGMRRRVLEPPLGSKIGYHELEDEKEEADEEWMTGEASQLSGAGTRGSSNWVLKILLPILLIIGIIILHGFWTDVKKHASNAANAVGDVFDRRALQAKGEHGQALQEEQDGGGQGVGRTMATTGGAGSSTSGREDGIAGERARQQQQQQQQQQAVYSVNLGDGGSNADQIKKIQGVWTSK